MLINIVCKVKREVISVNKIKQIVYKVIKYLFKKDSNKVELNIVLVNNKVIRDLNKRFFNKNTTTDVISFNYTKYEGEIIISVEEIIKQSKYYNNTIKKEFIFVLVHGLLHLYGMEDYTKKDKIKMQNFATKIIKKLNICL